MTFFDIFSKKPIENDKPKIIIDFREKNSLVPSELVKIGLEIEFQQLKVGDYVVNNTPIERKTIQDLKSSVISKRIFDQLKNLQLNRGILIIEGIQKEDIYSGIMHENAFRGFLLSLALNNKVPFIFSQNEKDTSKYISVLANKKEKTDFSLRQSRITPTKSEQIQFILEGFPNVGPKTAQELIKKFKSLRNIFKASKEELEKVLGKRTSEFLEIINYS